MVRSSTINGLIAVVLLGVFIYIFMVFAKGGGLEGIKNLLNRSLPQQQQQQQSQPQQQQPQPQEQQQPKQKTSKKQRKEEPEPPSSTTTPETNPLAFGPEDRKLPYSPPGCGCPQKPACDALCNTPETFKYCCFGKIVTGNRARIIIA